MNLTKKQIDHIVNVNGLKSPRCKSQKKLDQWIYEKGYKKEGNIQKSIYNVVKETI